jgi:hypothetical protein
MPRLLHCLVRPGQVRVVAGQAGPHARPLSRGSPGSCRPTVAVPLPPRLLRIRCPLDKGGKWHPWLPQRRGRLAPLSREARRIRLGAAVVAAPHLPEAAAAQRRRSLLSILPLVPLDVFCFGERSPIAFAGPPRSSSAVLRAPCGSRPVLCLVKTISAHHRAQSHAVTNCPLALKRARTIPSPRAPWQAYHGACNI